MVRDNREEKPRRVAALAKDVEGRGGGGGGGGGGTFVLEVVGDAGLEVRSDRGEAGVRAGGLRGIRVGSQR